MYLAKDNICVIYDDDESYAKRLMGIINDSKDIPYRAKSDFGNGYCGGIF